MSYGGKANYAPSAQWNATLQYKLKISTYVAHWQSLSFFGGE
jgi:hypothetical protein